MSSTSAAADSSSDADCMTIQEAVNALQTEEEESIAVFGAGDENNCTYILVIIMLTLRHKLI